MKFIKVMAVLAVAISTAACAEVVDTGHRGVETRFGKVQETALVEGLYFYNPITTRIIQMDVRTTTVDGKTEAYTRDVQQAEIGFAVSYNLNPEFAHHVFEKVGSGWEQTLLSDLIPDAIKNVIGKYEAVELIAMREKVTPEIVSQLRARIADKVKERGLAGNIVSVGSFSMKDISFTKQFESAVEAKVIAVQQADRERNQTVQIQEKARQNVITVKGQADALVVQSMAEAEAMAVRAKAEAQAMEIKNKALVQNQALIEYEAVQRWDGKLPQYSMGNAVPFINLK